MMADTNDDAAIETALPERDESGVTLINGLPLNHRLRAEALARAGKSEDPDGLIAPELIENAGERLAREDAAQREEERANPPLASLTIAKLEEIAADEAIDLSTAETKADRVSLIEAARAARTGA